MNPPFFETIFRMDNTLFEISSFTVFNEFMFYTFAGHCRIFPDISFWKC